MTEKFVPVNANIRRKYNAEEFFEFTKDKEERYELIDGRIYFMASPNVTHQRITGFIYNMLANYLNGKKCEPFMAPLDVFLFEKDKENRKDKSHNVFQPDVFVVYDKDKMSQSGINGAPDFIAEVVSPSSEINDYLRKFNIYLNNGVKEYWIVNPETKEITVYVNMQKGEELVDDYKRYTFGDKVKVSIFEDFEIDFKELQI